jgi:hypothetical protein
MFIKHGDGKILSVVETDEMTEEQKKAARNLVKKTVKTGDAETSSEKKSEE